MHVEKKTEVESTGAAQAAASVEAMKIKMIEDMERLAEKFREAMIGQPFTITYASRTMRLPVVQVRKFLEELSHFQLVAIKVDSTGEQKFLIITDPSDRLKLNEDSLKNAIELHQDYLEMNRFLSTYLSSKIPEADRKKE